MDLLCPGWLLLLGGGGIVGALLVGLVVLLKLGVIADYATRKEKPDQGEYSLEDSHESGE